MVRTPSANRDVLEPGRALGRYEVAERLPDAGRAPEYRALESLGLGGTREVVITLHATARSAAHVARRAATVVHPVLLQVLDAGSEGELHYTVRPSPAGEEGAEVAAWVTRGAAPVAGVAERVVADVADLVAAAHARGVCHGELSPASVVLARSGAVFVLPFEGQSADAKRREGDVRALRALYGAFGGRERLPEGDAVDVARFLRAHVSAVSTSAGLAGLLEALAADARAREPAGLQEPQRTPWVGRDALLGRLAAGLGREGWMLVAGPAGVGKSRLVEAHLAGLPAEADRLCPDLASDPPAAALGRALGIAEGSPDARRAAVVRALAARGPALVVMDDADACLEAAVRLAREIRAAAPEVQVLLGARRFLPGIPTLAVDGLAERDALALLEALAGPADSLTARRALVAELEGNPLALELAARRLALLGTDALLRRLRDAGAGAGAVATALEASWKELPEALRRVLEQLSVFAGSFDVPAAEALVVASSEGQEGTFILLDHLAALQARSLLVTERAPEGVRLRLAATVRGFAAEKCAARGDPASVFRRHRRYFTALAGDVPLPELGRLEPELRAAAQRAGAAEARADALLALRPLVLAGGSADLRELATALLGSDLDAPRRAGLLRLRGRCAAQAGDVGAALKDVRMALREVRSAPAEVALLVDAAELQQTSGELDAAEASLQRASARIDADPEAFRASPLRARTQRGLGMLAHARGELERAWSEYARAHADAEERRDPRARAEMRQLLGTLRLQQGRLTEAESHLEVALRLHQELGFPGRAGAVLGNLGILAQERGQRELARLRYRDALSMLQRVGERLLVAHVLGYQASLALEEGQLHDAAEAYEAALPILREIGDHRLAGVFSAALGGLELMRGNRDAGAAAFHAATSKLRVVGDPALLEALAVHRAHEHVLAYDDALAAGDARAAEVAFAAAEAALTTASDPRSDDLRFALRLLREALAQRALIVAGDGRWFAPPGGTPVQLGRREAARGMLRAFAEHRLSTPGGELDAETLMEAGWPGARIRAVSANNRVHVTLSDLRKLGLKRYIVRRGDGWCLDPAVPLRREDPVASTKEER